MFNHLPPITLYIHFPWCIQKCPYCDFNSHAVPEQMPEDAYIHQLIADFRHDLGWLQGRQIDSIFCGGGTPSLFSSSAIAKILSVIREESPLKSGCEITLEANPGKMDQAYFDGYRMQGVNRISLGVQSWNDVQLKRLGRIHDRQQAQQALDILNQFELTNVNVDLMYGLPQQTMAEALIDLETACRTGVPHISWYHLTLEPNTLFHHRPPKGLPSQDLVWEFELAGRDLLAKYGYHRYEVSAYSQLNRECQHNLNYWEFGDYLGIGAGAHSKLTDANSGQVWRLMKHKHPQAYLLAKDEFFQTKTCVTSDDLPFEFMLNAMRLLKPIPFDLFEQRTGVSRITIMPILEQLAEDHLLAIENQQFELTALGYQFLDDVTAEFLKL